MNKMNLTLENLEKYPIMPKQNGPNLEGVAATQHAVESALETL
ncbi:hypothetical protein [Fictibacillus terranigra]|uniref:Uncharacterized protein n=1 Tax=Fictibacillus terranigra TaxID=3058424 RepID=A0ABT8EBL1_9BACL|nr:hypothetical protein [Fictibacillus sp. CENA-BCM004]MDN4075275.1 hypothetical protein [Fictibacillus sp. CENA-BCM004]